MLRLSHCTIVLFLTGTPGVFAEDKDNKPASAPLADSERSCSFLLEHVIVTYSALLAHLPKDKMRLSDGKPLVLPPILTAKNPSCQSGEQNAQILSSASKLLTLHSGKIGLLLPDAAKQSGATASVVAGMKAYYAAKGADFDKRVIVKEASNDPGAILARIAELVFVDQVGILIGGLNELETGILSDWAEKLMIPALLLAPSYGGATTLKFTFHIFPRPDDLVGRILQHLASRGLKRIAIMSPAKQKPSRVIALLMDTLPRKGFTVVQSLNYNPSDYNSMETATRQLLRIDNTLRAEEYEKLLQQSKDRALAEKAEFHPEHVVLPPLIDFDALILPDNFRNIRHFVQIFKFLKVKGALPMIGTQEWRAFGLINPPEPMLDKSVFVDYIGSYLEIPEGIKPALYSPPFFVNPEETAKIDYMIIGYQASRMANLALQKPPTKRRKLAERLMTLQNTGSSYFPPGPAFAANHTAFWPSFLFEVNGSTIRLAQGGSLAAPAAPPSSPRDGTPTARPAGSPAASSVPPSP